MRVKCQVGPLSVMPRTFSVVTREATSRGPFYVLPRTNLVAPIRVDVSCGKGWEGRLLVFEWQLRAYIDLGGGGW